MNASSILEEFIKEFVPIESMPGFARPHMELSEFPLFDRLGKRHLCVTTWGLETKCLLHIESEWGNPTTYDVVVLGSGHRVYFQSDHDGSVELQTLAAAEPGEGPRSDLLFLRSLCDQNGEGFNTVVAPHDEISFTIGFTASFDFVVYLFFMLCVYEGEWKLRIDSDFPTDEEYAAIDRRPFVDEATSALFTSSYSVYDWLEENEPKGRFFANYVSADDAYEDSDEGSDENLEQRQLVEWYVHNKVFGERAKA